MGTGVRRMSMWGLVPGFWRAVCWAYWSYRAWSYRRQARGMYRHADAVGDRAGTLRRKAQDARRRADQLARGA